MNQVQKILNNKKYLTYLLVASFIFVSIFYIWNLNKLPLTSYDETTYGIAIRSTINSGQWLSSYKYNEPWINSPPIYFWLAMISSKIFNVTEFALRLPSAIFAILTIVFTYFLTKKLTNKITLAWLSAFVLSMMPYFFITSRQVRLDVPVTFFILATILATVTGWRKPKYLYWTFPLLAIAFMTKSVVAFLFLPIILLFSFFYKKWDWFRKPQLWWGLLISLLIVMPWHWHQSIMWGKTFWQLYMGRIVWNKINIGFGDTTHFYYLQKLWEITQPWWQLFLILIITTLISWKFYKNKKIFKLFLASLLSFAVVLIFFSLSPTRISTYLLPVYPLLAMTIATGIYYIWQISKKNTARILYILTILILSFYSLLLSSGYLKNVIEQFHYPFDNTNKDIGSIISQNSAVDDKIYQLDGPLGDVLSYYAQKPVIIISKDQIINNQIFISSPAWLYLTDKSLPIFFYSNGQPKPQYENIKLYYYQDNLILLYTLDDLKIDIIR
jgi:4-amino-4-deoxy-L-arabinose transferase-like glycosyltransferase